MKMFWWQGGLHIEPEDAEDRKALMKLWEAKRVPPDPCGQQPESTGVVGVKLLDVGVRG